MIDQGRRALAPLVVALIGILAAGAWAGACGGAGPPGAQPMPPASRSASPSTASELSQSVEGLQPSAPPVRQPAPTRLTIPAIGVDSQVIPVGTDSGVLQVPPDPWVVGWWSDGVGPGAGYGTVVLDAHLDSRQYGTGPFVRATELVPGDVASVWDEVGGAHQYRVVDVETYRRDDLPYQELFAQQGPERAVLVTCGGTYQRERGGWDSNVVVVLEPS